MRPRLHRAHQGAEEPRDRHAGAGDPQEPHAPRRDGRRSAAGRRRRHPDPDARRASCARPAAARARRCRRSATTASGMVFLPKEPASRMACEQEIERAIASEGQVLLGWRDVPTRQRRPVDAHRRRSSRSSGRCSSARGANDIGPGRARAQALHHPQEVRARDPGAEAARTARSSTCRRCRRARIVYKGMLLAHQVGEYFLDLRTRAWCRRWRWSTSASRPTRSRPGTSRTRSA